MSSSFVHFDLQDILSTEEQALFAANARRRGRKPAQHFKDVMFGTAEVAHSAEAEQVAREDAEFAAAGADGRGMGTEGRGATPFAPAVRITAIRATGRRKEGGGR